MIFQPIRELGASEVLRQRVKTCHELDKKADRRIDDRWIEQFRGCFVVSGGDTLVEVTILLHWPNVPPDVASRMRTPGCASVRECPLALS